MGYELIDSGDEEKLERFGNHLFARPCFQAIWEKKSNEWENASYVFTREEKNQWKKKGRDESWVIDFEGMKVKLAPTEFGHIGLFPEHATLWKWMQSEIKPGFKLLNLFAYTGCASIAGAQAGAKVTHVDASKKAVAWAKENGELNKVDGIRWIVDDVMKFMKREIKRENRYDGIILDPPTFGRGLQGQVFKIEEHLLALLQMCKEVLSQNAGFVILSCHTPGYSPLILQKVMSQVWKNASFDIGEMLIDDLPCGSYAKWVSS